MNMEEMDFKEKMMAAAEEKKRANIVPGADVAIALAQLQAHEE